MVKCQQSLKKTLFDLMVMARLDGNVGIRYELHVSWGCGFAIKCIVLGAISEKGRLTTELQVSWPMTRK